MPYSYSPFSGLTHFSPALHPKNLSEYEIADVERELSVARENRKAANGGFAIEAVGGVIPVYWHVINSGTAVSQGNISDAQIASQISVLNAAYSGTGWRPRESSVDKAILARAIGSQLGGLEQSPNVRPVGTNRYRWIR